MSNPYDYPDRWKEIARFQPNPELLGKRTKTHGADGFERGPLEWSMETQNKILEPFNIASENVFLLRDARIATQDFVVSNIFKPAAAMARKVVAKIKRAKSEPVVMDATKPTLA